MEDARGLASIMVHFLMLRLIWTLLLLVMFLGRKQSRRGLARFVFPMLVHLGLGGFGWTTGFLTAGGR